MADGRATFWPTVLLGAAAAALTAAASSRDWAVAAGDVPGVAGSGVARGSDAAPLTLALSLVALAGWGAMLVVRRRARRVFAALGLLASAGAAAAAAFAGDRALQLAREGAVGTSVQADLTSWFYVARVAAIVCAAAFLVALMRSAAWPEMSAKYDAPGAPPGSTGREPDQTDLWKALDDGRDPTV